MKLTRTDIAKQLGMMCRGFSLRALDFDVEMSADIPLVKMEAFAGLWSRMAGGSLPKQDEMDLLLKDMKRDLLLDYEQPEYRAESLCRRVLYGRGAMGNLPDGSPRSLQVLSPQGIQARRESLHALPGWLGVSGDVTDRDLEVLARAMLVSDGNGLEPVDPSLMPGRRLGLWHDSTQDQATFCIQWSLGRVDPGMSLMDLRLAEMLLTSDFSSVLSTEFRQKSGLTYGIYGSHRLHPSGGAFQIRFSTEGVLGPRMLSEVLAALEVFATNGTTFGITDRSGTLRRATVPWSGDPFESCRNKALSSLPFLVATEADRVSRRLEEAVLGTLGTNNLRRAELLRSATVESVAKAARWLFLRQNMAVAITDNLTQRGKEYIALDHWSRVDEDIDSLCGLT